MNEIANIIMCLFPPVGWWLEKKRKQISLKFPSVFFSSHYLLSNQSQQSGSRSPSSPSSRSCSPSSALHWCSGSSYPPGCARPRWSLRLMACWCWLFLLAGDPWQKLTTWNRAWRRNSYLQWLATSFGWSGSPRTTLQYLLQNVRFQSEKQF